MEGKNKREGEKLLRRVHSQNRFLFSSVVNESDISWPGNEPPSSNSELEMSHLALKIRIASNITGKFLAKRMLLSPFSLPSPLLSFPLTHNTHKNLLLYPSFQQISLPAWLGSWCGHSVGSCVERLCRNPQPIHTGFYIGLRDLKRPVCSLLSFSLTDSQQLSISFLLRIVRRGLQRFTKIKRILLGQRLVIHLIQHPASHKAKFFFLTPYVFSSAITAARGGSGCSSSWKAVDRGHEYHSLPCYRSIRIGPSQKF